MKKINICGRLVGQGEPPYFIADIAANHDGDLGRAFRLIELAKEAGADAAKFQNFRAPAIVSKRGFEDLGGQFDHQKTWKKPVYEVYQDASVPYDWTPLLRKKCDEVGIHYFTSPYDFESVDHVDPWVPAYKIGSGDITWPEIIAYMARKGKPVLIAAGASTLEDVQRAMNVILDHTQDVVLMQCNTNYTASAANFRCINLNVLRTFRKLYPEAILGLSDHTHGHTTVLGALALGALVFEKHFTDDNGREGPDHRFAMNPVTWREMVDRSMELYYALGDGIKRVEANEDVSVMLQRRALRAVRNLPEGHIIQDSDLEALRPIPSDGIAPYRKAAVIGKKLIRPVEAGGHISVNNIE